MFSLTFCFQRRITRDASIRNCHTRPQTNRPYRFLNARAPLGHGGSPLEKIAFSHSGFSIRSSIFSERWSSCFNGSVGPSGLLPRPRLPALHASGGKGADSCNRADVFIVRPRVLFSSFSEGLVFIQATRNAQRYQVRVTIVS